MSDKYAVIAAERGTYPVRWMCALLGVSVAGFYGAQQRSPEARRAADERVRVEVRAAYAKSHRRYGAPRVHRELRAAGVRVAKKRVARLTQDRHRTVLCCARTAWSRAGRIGACARPTAPTHTRSRLT